MFDGERDSGTSYGGRPRIGTYLLINLYRLVRGARTALIEREREKKRRGANLYRGTSRYCTAKERITRVVLSPASEMAECNEA